MSQNMTKDTPDTQPNPGVTLLTLSFQGDFDLCALMCASGDRFVPKHFGHQLYVPEGDFELFARLLSDNRLILAEHQILPRWLRKAPLPAQKWRRRLGLPRRNVYLTPYSWPVRGWIAQQMMKIEAASRAPTEIVLHVDSDVVFVRPLRLEHLMRSDGRVRLYETPDPKPIDTHVLWRATARRLLGLPQVDPDVIDFDYITAAVVWRRSVVQKMLAKIEEVGGGDWRVILARTPHFSEYILYGTYAKHVLGLDAAGLFESPTSLCHCRWTGTFETPADEISFCQSLHSEEVACLLQSTLPMSLDQRRHVFELVATFAAGQAA